MDIKAIERALAASEARPLLVDPRVVRRVIKRHCHLPGVGLQVPHARCYAIARGPLLSIADPAELGRPAAEVPEEVILLPRPEAEDLAERPGVEILTELWRYTFHALVHQEIARLSAAGTLTPARIRERIHRIGQTEFDEIRLVLRQDRILLPPYDDLGTYTEFAALYLELRTFAPGMIAEIFPTLVDPAAALAALGEDLDVDRLLAAARPEGAELPAPGEGEARAEKDEETPPRAVEAVGEQVVASARRRGNLVRAALLSARAGKTGEVAEAARELSERLARAVRPRSGGEEEAAGIDVEAWSRALGGLVDRAVSRGGLFRQVEARLLYDLQSACLAGEKAIGKVSLVEWALSLGRRPLARLLPATRPIRVARYLADAMEKVPRVGLPERERTALRELLADARHRADEAIRAELRPPVLTALREVGFRPGSVPERVALSKLVEELLDQATAHGHLGLGQLRDAVSRNALKIADVSGPGELFGEDPLLAADRRLAEDLDGVHQRGEIYLRALQKGSSVLFGTGSGRWITFYMLLPIGGGYMLPFATGLVITEIGHLLGLMHHHQELELLPKPNHLATAPLVDLWPFPVIAVLIFALLHSALARKAALAVLHVLGLVLSTLFLRVPRWIASRPLVRRLLRSRVALALGRFMIKPAAVGAAGGGLVEVVNRLHVHRRHHLLAHLPQDPVPVAIGLFAVSLVFLNTRAGILAEEAALDGLARALHRVQRDVLPGIYRLILRVSRWFTDSIDRGIYTVDEWLRFREGQSRVALLGKAVLGVVWFAIAYVLRIYVNLLIEPTFNPIKHFPTVTVAAKIMLPVDKELIGDVAHLLQPKVGLFLGGTLGWLVAGSLPGFFGFLVWELKENYKLYQATRAATLRPVPIGHHGETMGGLLRPGIHSGTLPKLWAKLRRAARKGDGSVEKHREAMREIEEAVERFVDRELCAILVASDLFPGAVHVSRVALASNRVRVEIRRGGHGGGEGEPCVIAFEEQSGWLVAGVAHPGWAAALDAGERVVLENALAGLYHHAGVDLVREQIAAALPPTARYDIADEGLVVWPPGFATEVVYDLASQRPSLTAKVRGDATAEAAPALDRVSLLFREQGLRWTDWVAAWSGAPVRVMKGASLLPG